MFRDVFSGAPLWRRAVVRARHARRDLPRDRAYLPFEIPHGGFGRVVAVDAPNRRVLEPDQLRCQPMLFQLAPDELAAGHVRVVVSPLTCPADAPPPSRHRPVDPSPPMPPADG